MQNEVSVGSERPGVVAKDLFKSLILPAVRLHDAVIDPWMQATRYGRVDFADVCCTSDSLLSGAVTSIGGHGFHLTTKAGKDKLKEDLLEKKPRVVWMKSSLYHTTHTTISINIKVSSNTNEHPGSVSLACEARLV